MTPTSRRFSNPEDGVQDLRQQLIQGDRTAPAALAAGSIGTWRWNLETEEVEFDELERAIWGIEGDEPLSAASVFGAIHPDDLEGVQNALQPTIAGHGTFVHQFRIIRSDGTVRWLQGRGDLVEGSPGTPSQLVGVNFDITEARERDKELIELRRTQDIALESVGLGVWKYDPKGDVVRADARTFTLLGLDAPEDGSIARLAFDTHAIPEDRAALEHARLQAIDLEGPGVYDVEFRVKTRVGLRWLRSVAHCYFVRDAQGMRVAAESIYGVIQDITDRRDTADRLSVALERAEAANAAKSAFLAHMSHEIRTPMTAILGFADVLAKSADEQQLEVVDTIRRNGSHLLEILNDILDLTKIEAGEVDISEGPFDIASLLKDAGALMSARAQETGNELVVMHGDGVPEQLVGDETRMRQVVLNLVGNALKFTSGGVVRITSSFELTSSMLSIAVEDTGMGIDPKEIEQLFQPFVQAERTPGEVRGGTGLGLSISRRLCRAMGGELSAESVLGQGSCFTLRVPIEVHDAQQNAPMVAEEAAAAAEDDQLGGLRLLVVEDHPELRMLMSMLLEEAGAIVTSASHGQEAVEIVVGDPTHFDCILMDMRMPVLDGHGATRALRAAGVKTPVIAVTAHALREEQEACLASGCTAYTSKPIEEEELMKLIRSLTNDGATSG
jgi:PAS domain S-box-containing protein